MNPTNVQLLKDNLLAIEFNIEDSAANTVNERVIIFENRLTLDDIKTCLDNEPEEHLEQALKDLLAARWERVKNTAMCYTEAPLNATNCLCATMANILSPLPKSQDELDEMTVGEGPYFLLMPSLAAATDISGANIHEYNLHQFILSDDNRVFIPLQIVLDYAKDRQQGLFHVVSTDPAHYDALSSNEIERISNHSIAVQNYLQAILNLQKIKKESAELGPQLRRLIESLRQGGAHRQGKEYDSGAAANLGIVAFSTYWGTLSPGNQQELYKKYIGLEHLIGRLMRPNSTDYQNVTYCVELISNDLETLCDRHAIGRSNFSQIETQCTLAKERLKNLLNSERQYILFPSKAPFHNVLPLLFELTLYEQRRILSLPGDRDAWTYALEHAPEVLHEFTRLLSRRNRQYATSAIFPNGKTPLFIAIEAGCERAVRLLIECGVSVITTDPDGYTPLMRAAMKGNEGSLSLLLTNDRLINSYTHLGDTALTLAIRGGHRAIVEALLARDASLCPARALQNPIELAIAHHPELLDLLLLKAVKLKTSIQTALLENVPGHFLNIVGFTAAKYPSLFMSILSDAIQQKNKELLNATHLVYPNGSTTPIELSTLSLAVQYGNVDQVRVLLDAGARIYPLTLNAQSVFRAPRETLSSLITTPKKNDFPALIMAASEGKLEIVALLLERNAAIDAQNSALDTALTLAVKHGHRAVVDALLTKNASIMIRNSDGKNALDLAVEHHPELLESLLLAAVKLPVVEQKNLLRHLSGADEDIVSYTVANQPHLFMSLARDAIQKGNTQFLNASYMVRHAETSDPLKISTLGMAVLYGDVHDVQELLEAGARVDSVDPIESSALILAAKDAKLEVLTFLLDKNASIDKVGKDKNTALHCAIANRHQAIVEALLAKNASIVLRNNAGDNPFDIAVKEGDLDDILLSLLLKAVQLDPPQQKEWLEHLGGNFRDVISFTAKLEPLFLKSVLSEAIQRRNTPLLNLDHHVGNELAPMNVTSTLAIVVQNGNVGDVRELLDAGAEVDPMSPTSISALRAAICLRKLDIVALLLERNAFIDRKENHETGLAVAIKLGHRAIVEALLMKNATITSEHLNAAKRSNELQELLLLKAVTFSSEEQKALLRNVTLGYHEHVLSYAAEIAPLTSKYIINRAIETNNRAILDATFITYLLPKRTPNRISTLALMAFYRDTASIQALLDAGVEINPIEPGCLGALMISAMNGDVGVVKFLLEKNASIDLLNTENNTALNLAIINGHRAVVEALLLKNASITMRNKGNQNAFDLAVAYHPELLPTLLLKAVTLGLEEQKSLLKNMAQGTYENVFSYAAKEAPHLLKQLVSEAIRCNNTALLNATHYQGQQAISTLSLAVLYGDDATVQNLLALGIDCNDATKDGLTTALVFAIKQPNASARTITRLLDKGARVDLYAYEDCSRVYWDIKSYGEATKSALRSKGVFLWPNNYNCSEFVNATLQFLPEENKVILNIKREALLLKSKRELSGLIAAIPPCVTHVSINGQNLVEKKKLPDTALMILSKINFNEHMARFKVLEDRFRSQSESAPNLVAKNNKHKPTYRDAALAATMLCQTLERARDTLARTYNKAEFIASCEAAIQGAQELTRHRGWKLAIAEFVRDLLSLVSKKLVTALTNKYHWFAPKTTSHKKLDEFASTLHNCSQST